MLRASARATPPTLLTVRDEGQMQRLLQEQGDNVTAWIGLTAGLPFHCGTLKADEPFQVSRDCEEQQGFICQAE
ncbi:hypothetical protein GN956_G22798 [Arapaima gigas]